MFLVSWDTVCITFAFMHFVDAFLQSDLHCTQGTSVHALPGNRTHDLVFILATAMHITQLHIVLFLISKHAVYSELVFPSERSQSGETHGKASEAESPLNV